MNSSNLKIYDCRKVLPFCHFSYMSAISISCFLCTVMSDLDETQDIIVTHNRVQNDVSNSSQRQSPDDGAALYNNDVIHKTLIQSLRERMALRIKAAWIFEIHTVGGYHSVKIKI